MPHHGSSELPEWMHDKLCDEERERLGATGKFPQGQMSSDDEGEIRFRVGSDGDKVFIDFGKPTAWLGMDPQQAADLAASILQHARAASKAAGTSLKVQL